jgi:hypothetical protein
MNEAIENSRAILRRKYLAMERHIDDVNLSALNNNEYATSSRIDASAEQAERCALARLKHLSRSIDEAECAVVRAMLLRMDAAAPDRDTNHPAS